MANISGRLPTGRKTGKTGGKNRCQKRPRLDPTTVTSNGVGNTPTGHNGGVGELNLYYGLAPASETTDYDPTLGEVFINC